MNHHLRPLELKLTITLFGLASGCSSSYIVGSPDELGSEYTYQEMNEELNGRHVRIELKDGRDISAKEVEISGDSVSWVDRGTDERWKSGIREVNKIVVKSSSIGALEGMGFGLAGGGGLGFLLGMSQHSREIPMEFVGLIVGGGGGLIVGLITGVIAGHSYSYEFPLIEPSDSLQNGK